MASLEEKRNYKNAIRTNLLLLANEELSSLKKNNELSKINSKKIIEAEDYYGSKNSYIVKLREENFIPSSITRDVIQSINVKNKFSFKSPDSQNLNSNFIRKSKANESVMKDYNNKTFVVDNKLNLENLNSNFNFELDLFAKRYGVSSKKNQHFKLKTLKIKEKEQDLMSKF